MVEETRSLKGSDFLKKRNKPPFSKTPQRRHNDLVFPNVMAKMGKTDNITSGIDYIMKLKCTIEMVLLLMPLTHEQVQGS